MAERRDRVRRPRGDSLDDHRSLRDEKSIHLDEIVS
jgi:hypothetical protein